MISNLVSVAVLALGAARLASAQTSTLCNPLKTTCPPDPAFGGQVTVDFTKGASSYFTAAAGTSITYDPNNGAVFTIKSPSDAPTISSTKYLFFGRVDVTAQAAPGTGVVSSFVLQSDDLDEIDWEWLGGDNIEVQTNYYSKGDTSSYDRGGFSPVGNPVGQFHTYSIDWSPTSLNWIIDGNVVRTLNYEDAHGGATYPQTPMQIKLGIWDGGAPNEAPGTVQWAGGYTNFNNAPFNAYYKSVTITDRSNGVSDASEYVYGDQSGTFTSIQVHGGGAGNTTNNEAGTTTTTAPATTATKTTATKATTTTASNTTTTHTTTLSTSTVSVSNTTTSVSTPSSTAAGTTSSSTAPTAAPKNAAGRVGIDMANAAFVVAALFSYLIL